MDAPMPLPANPPALVRRWCNANGCYVQRIPQGFVNPPAVVPKDFPMPMPKAVEAAMPAPRLFAKVTAPVRDFFSFVRSHRPRLFFK